jgi:putative transposase
MLRREGLRASRKRIYALMKAEGLTLKPDSVRDPQAPRGQVVCEDINRRWSIDLTTTWTQKDGLVAIVPLMDNGCRTVLDLEVTKCQEVEEVVKPLERALVREFGSPDNVPDGLEIRTDHGPQFTGFTFEAFTGRWRLAHTLAPIGRPTGNSAVERVIKTMKEETIWLRDWKSIEELRAALRRWLEEYNGLRPHQALEWRTPNEERAAKAKRGVAA